MSQSPIISILTPTHDPLAPYLRAAYESILAIKLDWEWVLQFDGVKWENAPDWLFDDHRIKLECNGGNWGAGVTRNKALNRTQGQAIQALDADDYLLPGAVEALFEILMAFPHVGYVIGRTKHLDGETFVANDGHKRTHKVEPLPFGEIYPGVLFDHWQSQNCYLPLNPNCALWKRDVLFAQKGWAGLDVSEDLPLLLGASESSTGYYLDQFVSVYRQHEKSLMHQSNVTEESRHRRIYFAKESITAARRLKSIAE